MVIEIGKGFGFVFFFFLVKNLWVLLCREILFLVRGVLEMVISSFFDGWVCFHVNLLSYFIFKPHPGFYSNLSTNSIHFKSTNGHTHI